MFRSGHAAHGGELLQEWQGEQGGLGRLHQDNQKEHKPERRGCCHHGCLKGASFLFHQIYKLKFDNSVHYVKVVTSTLALNCRKVVLQIKTYFKITMQNSIIIVKFSV